MLRPPVSAIACDCFCHKKEPPNGKPWAQTTSQKGRGAECVTTRCVTGKTAQGPVTQLSASTLQYNPTAALRRAVPRFLLVFGIIEICQTESAFDVAQRMGARFVELQTSKLHVVLEVQGPAQIETCHIHQTEGGF